ncbi:MAG TPA: hypothetical protein DD375_12770, partial [Hyphomonas sp.]|nr:hypothetical protein [Hyphomonas sp.]
PEELLETTPDESVEDLPESIPDEQPEEIPEDLVEEIEPEIEPVEETLPPVPDPVVEPDPEMEPVAEAPLELEPQPEPVPEVDLPDVAELEPDPDEAMILPEPSDAPLQTLATPVQQPATTAQPFARPQPFGRPPPVRVPGIEFSLPPATAGGGGGALGALLCHKLTEEQRLKANCDLDATKQAYKDAANAGLDRDEQNRLDGTYDGQLRSTLPDDSAFESFLKRNDGIPKTTLDGIDNTIFMDRKPESERQHDQLMRGDTTEWEDEVFEAHQDED